MQQCEEAIESIRTRHFTQWVGLPVSCDWTPLTGPLPSDWGATPHRALGSQQREARFIMLPIDGYYRPSLSFVDGTPTLFEAMGPQLANELADLLLALGTPTAKLDWVFGTLPLPASEFVFPKRGITLFLNSAHDRALHLALYPSTTLDAYRTHFRPQLAKRRAVSKIP